MNRFDIDWSVPLLVEPHNFCRDLDPCWSE